MNTFNTKSQAYIEAFLKDIPADEKVIFKKIFQSIFKLDIKKDDIFTEEFFIVKAQNQLQKELFNITEQYLENGDLVKLAAHIGCAKIIAQFIQNHSPQLIELLCDTQAKNNKSATSSCYFIEKYEHNGKIIIEDVIQAVDPKEQLKEDIYMNTFDSPEQATEAHSFMSEIVALENEEINKDPYLYKLIQKNNGGKNATCKC